MAAPCRCRLFPSAAYVANVARLGPSPDLRRVTMGHWSDLVPDGSMVEFIGRPFGVIKDLVSAYASCRRLLVVGSDPFLGSSGIGRCVVPFDFVLVQWAIHRPDQGSIAESAVDPESDF